MLRKGYVINETYRVEGLIGTGGMANVYEVTHIRFRKKMALKLIHINYASDDEYRKRFLAEADLLGTLNHPNIVSVTDVHTTAEGTPYMVMERLYGKTLGTYIAEEGPVAMGTLLVFAHQVAQALHAAHRHTPPIVHRDLTPANIFLCDHGDGAYYVKVLDFGIAKWHHPEKGVHTQGPTTMGTPPYMSPEQIKGEDVDGRSDLFSLGAILFEMVTGQRAFMQEGDSPERMRNRVLYEEPFIPANQIEQVIRRLLKKRREERYANVVELATDLGTPITGPEFASRFGGTGQAVIPPTHIPRIRAEPLRVDSMHDTLIGVQDPSALLPPPEDLGPLFRAGKEDVTLNEEAGPLHGLLQTLPPVEDKDPQAPDPDKPLPHNSQDEPKNPLPVVLVVGAALLAIVGLVILGYQIWKGTQGELPVAADLLVPVDLQTPVDQKMSSRLDLGTLDQKAPDLNKGPGLASVQDLPEAKVVGQKVPKDKDKDKKCSYTESNSPEIDRALLSQCLNNLPLPDTYTYTATLTPTGYDIPGVLHAATRKFKNCLELKHEKSKRPLPAKFQFARTCTK